MSLFASLSVRNYRLFASGQVVSLTCTWMQRVAQDWLVLHLSHNSGTAIGVTTGLQFAPVLFFGLYGGVIADRFPKRRTLVITQIFMGLCALSLGLLFAPPRLEKFQSPAADCSRLICGWSMVNCVTCSACEVSSGHKSTPSVNERVYRKGVRL